MLLPARLVDAYVVRLRRRQNDGMDARLGLLLVHQLCPEKLSDQILGRFGDQILLRSLRRLIGQDLLHGLLGAQLLDRLAGSGGGLGCVGRRVRLRLSAADDGHHHLFHLAQFARVLVENAAGSFLAAEILVVRAAVEHDGQLFHTLVALLLPEGQRLFHHLGQPGAAALRRADGFAAHARELGVAALPLKGELSAGQTVVQQQSRGIDVRRLALFPVPVQLRRDEIQLLPVPVAPAAVADDQLARRVPAQVFRIDAAAIVIAGFAADHPAELQNQIEERLPAHAFYLFPQVFPGFVLRSCHRHLLLQRLPPPVSDCIWVQIMLT